MKYAYYPGCSLKGTAIEYHVSTLALVQRLGIEFVEMEDWVCCGASPSHQRNPILSTSIANLLLSLSEGIGPQIAVLCAACYNNMKKAEEEMRKDGKLRNEVEAVSGVRFNPATRTKHFLDILINEYGLEQLKAKVVRPLEGLKAACYYGCLLTRPPIVAFDDHEQPRVMEKVLEAAGVEPVAWTHRLECCGASHAVPFTEVVLRLVNDILLSAKDAGAEIIVCACPLCQANLDLRQHAIISKFGIAHNLPAVFFTQLLAIACGASDKDVMIHKGMVNARPLLNGKGFI
jgi:heterodisulfide reductase subunit B